MDFAFDGRTEQLRADLLDFMVSQVHPAEPVFAEQLAALDNRWAWSTVPVLDELRKRDGDFNILINNFLQGFR